MSLMTPENSQTYPTIAALLNGVFQANYAGYRQSHKVLDADTILWFPKFEKAGRNPWGNQISPDGMEIVTKYLGPEPVSAGSSLYKKYDGMLHVTFAKLDQSGYRFIGCFRKETKNDGTEVFTREDSPSFDPSPYIPLRK